MSFLVTPYRLSVIGCAWWVFKCTKNVSETLDIMRRRDMAERGGRRSRGGAEGRGRGEVPQRVEPEAEAPPSPAAFFESLCNMCAQPSVPLNRFLRAFVYMSTLISRTTEPLFWLQELSITGCRYVRSKQL